MSAPDLNAIRARAAAATQGPWEVERWEDFGGSPSYSIPGAERLSVTPRWLRVAGLLLTRRCVEDPRASRC